MSNIAHGYANHDFRKFRIPPQVCYFWYYSISPESSFRYVARVSSYKTPGEVPEDGGRGNAEFNRDGGESEFAYQILGLWELNRAITITDALSMRLFRIPPRHFNYAPEGLHILCPLMEQQRLIGEPQDWADWAARVVPDPSHDSAGE